jgi:hypothetical protein
VRTCILVNFRLILKYIKDVFKTSGRHKGMSYYWDEFTFAGALQQYGLLSSVMYIEIAYVFVLYLLSFGH